MCGIIGYNGTAQATPFLLDGLKKLEYRGYDSAGIAVSDTDGIKTEKRKGKIDALASAVRKRNDMTGTIGIGHTRWATHGAATNSNAHPHKSGKFTIVHNGIIENHKELKEKYLRLCRFDSDTDTETVAHLINRHYSGNCLEAIAQTARLLEGSFALAILCEDEPNTIFCAKKSSPLLIGVGDEASVASDISAISRKSDSLYRMDDGEIAAIHKNKVEFYDFELNEKAKSASPFTAGNNTSEKGEYEHFMLKEIFEQPEAVRKTVEAYIGADKAELLQQIKKPTGIYIVACGSAYHAGLIGRICIEKLTKTPTSVETASEFRYSDPLIDENTSVIIISQSGETADSLAALRLAKSKGAKTIAIVNVPESSIALESDFAIYTKAGAEIAVATTKAYSAQLAALYALSIHFARIWQTADSKLLNTLEQSLEQLHENIREALCLEKQMKEIAQHMQNTQHTYFIGRGIGFAVAAEASLKLKEISYIHSEAYAAGELKHGTISLIEKGTKVFAVCTPDTPEAKIQSNIDEVAARGANVIAFTSSPNIKANTTVISTTASHPLFSASTQVIPFQLLAYYTAKLRGCDIDKPRNLAKSVTVE
ncbi:MAG: glutamine--fructose-6-phosphate transaminase (isomerizing) [Clostridia bacterium]|nr:glutamine--fructose-6-phosphate transaminase (isomerizing) [Clostridia bacterium]